MADPRARQTPKGQARGAATEQQEFIQETQPAPAPAQPVQTQPLADLVEPEVPEDDEADGQILVEVDDGVEIDLAEILMGQTQRPEEAITAGLPGGMIAPERKVGDVLSRLIRDGFDSQDVRALAEIANALNL